VETYVKSKFKVGPAKLKNGTDAYIFEVSKEEIFGKYWFLANAGSGYWKSASWFLSGRNLKIDIYTFGAPLYIEDSNSYDLIPNVKLDKTIIDEVEFTAKANESLTDSYLTVNVSLDVREYLVNRKWKMTLEEIE